ncbi:MAG: aromatic ring-hydroxylating dioxygenase subunit alpha [Dehalococcoidia bacterium]
MTALYPKSQDMLNLVDRKTGLVDRRAFGDQEIYQIEMERVFARAWNFMAHDTQIPNPGDFFMTFIGEDRVIVVRDNEGNPQVLVNSCRHRGNAVCRAEEGHATSFMCTYHGWTYDLKGALVGVPGFKEVYHEELDRENWGLIKAGKVATYKGFIFATMDPEAVDLEEYLGDVGRLGLDVMATQDKMVLVGGIQKWTIGCNWKFAADNAWDYYHGGITHGSAGMSGWFGRAAQIRTKPSPPVQRWTNSHRVLLGDYGHGLSGPIITDEMIGTEDDWMLDQTWRGREDSKQILGEVGRHAGGHINVFPNLWVMQGHNQVSLRLPKGPKTTEIWWFTFGYEGQTKDERARMLSRAIHHNGPAGMFEIDDGENWGESTRGMVGAMSAKFPLNYAMNVHGAPVTEEEGEPKHIDTTVSEHAQLWFYESWSEWMAAESWADLKASHTPSPSGYV